MSRGYSIRDLADEFGVTARTLRHYEAIGLLRPARHGTVRVYSGRDRARLKVALRGKRAGLPLDEMRELFELYDRASVGGEHLLAWAAKLDEQRAALERQRDDVDAMLGEVAFFAEQCQRMLRSSESRSSGDR